MSNKKALGITGIYEEGKNLVKPKYHKIRSLGDISFNAVYFYGEADLFIKNLKKFSSGEVMRYENSPESFENFRKNGSSLENLWIQKRYNTGWFFFDNHKYYADSYLQFVLGRDDNDAAIASFEPCNKALLMTQIQGLKEQKDILSLINYPKIFINQMEVFAKENKIPEVFVLPHYRNRYEVVRENKHGEKRKYDVPARQMGFESDRERGVWVKKL